MKELMPGIPLQRRKLPIEILGYHSPSGVRNEPKYPLMNLEFVKPTPLHCFRVLSKLGPAIHCPVVQIKILWFLAF